MYVTKQDLIDRGWERQLIQLTDTVNKPATTIDDTTVARHIADAESIVDSYLGKVYALPLTSVPPALTKVAADLAIYFLHGDKVEKDGAIDRGYRDALRWLNQIASGLATLGDNGSPLQPAGGGRIQGAGPDRVFSRDSLRDF